MQINIQQYNSVVSGLRTQLEINREDTREVRAAFRSAVERLHEREQALVQQSGVIKTLNERIGALQAQLDTALNATEGIFPAGLCLMDANWSPAYDGIVSLHEKIAAKRRGKK